MVSFVIPTLDEASQLPVTLGTLPPPGKDFEWIVADGGSQDDTKQIAESSGARWIECENRGRAAQMNRGAAESRGSILVFLHADSRFCPGSVLGMMKAMADRRLVGGAFQRRFDHPSLFLNLTCLLADLRGRALGWFLGDQTIFVRSEWFLRLGGYRAWNSFEDLDLSMRMSKAGPTRLVSPGVVSSGRRFGPNPIRRSLGDLLLTLRFLATGGAGLDQGTGTNTAR